MDLGTALAVVAFADQCLKYGNKFVKRCKAYLNAEDEAKELLVSIESNWVKMETQIGILKRVAGSLSKRLQDSQAQVLSQLEGKLRTASLTIMQLMEEKRESEKANKWGEDDLDMTTMMKDLGGMRRSKKIKYATKKTSLYQILDEIENWQARYDPSWILIMQMANGKIDDELHAQDTRPENEQVPIIIAAKGIRDAVKASRDVKVRGLNPIWISSSDLDLSPEAIQHSSVQSSLLSDDTMVLIDTIVSNAAANENSTNNEVRNMARVLAEVDPHTFGLLRCRGVIKVPKAPSFASQTLTDFKFIFDVPYNLSCPQSLRSVLVSGRQYPLDERLDLAKRLTGSVLFVHTVQFVHKNIRPETIIVFQDEHSTIGSPFLAGFEQFRLEEGHTYRAGDETWEHNLYRHPTRQGLHPEVVYQMQHDIYSLGVVLLEIGLWTSFVVSDSDSDSSLPTPNSILGPVNTNKPQRPLESPAKMKKILEALAESELPVRLGRRYTDIVLLCLRCLDPGSSIGSGLDPSGKISDAADVDYADEDGVVIGVSYIENVLEKIHEINI